MRVHTDKIMYIYSEFVITNSSLFFILLSICLQKWWKYKIKKSQTIVGIFLDGGEKKKTANNYDAVFSVLLQKYIQRRLRAW